MFLKSTFSLPQASGFVAFDGGGIAEPDVQRRAPKTADGVVTPRLAPELARTDEPALEAANDWHGSRTWQPSTGALVRRVEAAVVVAICGYFAFGLAGVAGWL
jgi:hypothetical protein